MLADELRRARRVAFLGGAGVSTESGIPDFRSAHGLYQAMELPCEQILHHDFLMWHPAEFYDFYKKNMLYPDARPNAAHKALAQLEKMGLLSAVITQNIDGLHQAAGSRRVIELHGSVHRNYCVSCGKRYPLDAILQADGVPHCACGGMIRPDVVMYGEALREQDIDGAVRAIEAADLLIVGGTSLTVYPAAGLVRYARGRVVLINRDETPYDARCDLVLHESIGAALSAAVKALRNEKG